MPRYNGNKLSPIMESCHLSSHPQYRIESSSANNYTGRLWKQAIMTLFTFLIYKGCSQTKSRKNSSEILLEVVWWNLDRVHSKKDPLSAYGWGSKSSQTVAEGGLWEVEKAWDSMVKVLSSLSSKKVACWRSPLSLPFLLFVIFYPLSLFPIYRYTHSSHIHYSCV